jgi:predicted membrane channel-forming protein YqfA (hemolysin III family)
MQVDRKGSAIVQPEPGETTAELRAKEKLGLLNHLAIYLIVMTTLALLNLATSRHVLWFFWPLGLWGIALAVHALRVLVFSPRARLYSRLLEREKRHGT